jgi:outer membrane biosynthesis protein TonB
MIIGAVVLVLAVRPNGTVESAIVVSGHPLLRQAALDSAKRSQFERRKCSDPTTAYRLVFTFQLADLKDC